MNLMAILTANEYTFDWVQIHESTIFVNKCIEYFILFKLSVSSLRFPQHLFFSVLISVHCDTKCNLSKKPNAVLQL